MKRIAFLLVIFSSISIFAQTYTFTTAGAIGRFGPSQTQLNTAYASTNLNGLVTTTNGIQTWTVPTTGIYRITAYGAKGGNGWATTASGGAKVQGDFSFTVGQVLKILAGQTGSIGLVGGGGGGSFVTDNANAPLIIAGGGGGGAFDWSYAFGLSNNAGNISSSGMPGSNGNASLSVSVGGSSGSGGSVATTFTIGQGSGGGGLTGNGINGNPATGGMAFVNGGNGGAGTVSGTDIGGHGGFGGGGGGDWSNNTGAGGGGGYSGGGGGTYYGLGGGGGSYNGGTNQVNTSGFNTSNGYVVFTKLSGLNILQTSSINCNGQLTAALTASAFGGTFPYTYTWSPAVSSGSVASGLGAGVYTCSATDANSIVYTNTFVVNQPPLLVSTVSQTNVSCFAGSNGIAKVDVSGGTGPYSFTWSPSSSFSSSLTGLSIGNYTCHIKDVNNCLNIATVTITQPAALTVFGIASNPTVCSGNSSTLLGGGALTYTWSNGVTNAVAFTPTVTNNYTLTGADAAGCTATSVVGIVVNSSPTLNILGTSTLCTGNSTTLSVSGASTYTWSNFSTTSTIGIAPSITTSYSVSGTGANGCQNTAIKTVTVLNTTSVNANSSATAVCIGNSVTLFGSGATTFTWTGGVINNVSFTPTATAGYTVSGTGACGTASAEIIILVNTLPNVIANASSTSVCTGSQVTLFGSGATTYVWSNGVSNNVPFTISANNSYTVTGTDGNGCQNVATNSISVNPLPNVTASVSAGLICAGASVTFNGNGANTYIWTNGVINNIPFSPSTSGSYVVTGADINGCENTATTTVNVITVPVVTANSSTSAVCYGNALTLFGNGALSYSWSGGVINNTAFTPTATASYTVSGSNSCFTASNVITVTVNALPAITANVTNSVICFGNTTTLFGGGGTSYSWSGGVTNNVSFTPSSSNIYTVTGTDANGCQNTAIKSITVNSLPIVSAIVSNSIICYGNSTTLNGSGALTYTWSNGITNNVSFSPSVTTNFTVTGLDANGCQNSASKLITVNQLPLVTASSSNSVICFGNNVTLNGTGADTYTWTNGITNGLAFQPTVTTTYSVSGTNTLSGCTSTNVAMQTITVNALPNVSVVASNAIICSGNTITLSGTNADVYSWSNGILDAQAFSPTTTASYTVTGTNTLTGCTNTAIQGVTVNALPSLTITASNLVVCFGQSLTLNAQGADTYTWTNNVLNNVSFTPTASVNYSVMGTSSLTGCESTLTVSVIVNQLPMVSASASNSVVCRGNSVSLIGGGADTYTWTGGVTNSLPFQPISTASYSVIGTNTLTGCTSTNSAMQTITVNALPIVSSSASSSSICLGGSVFLTASGANTYTWTNGIVNGTAFFPSATTFYSVAGTNTLTGCTSTNISNQTINVNPLPILSITAEDNTICLGESVTLNAQGATNYSWSTNENGSSINVTPNTSTIYTVSGTDNAGCSNSTSFTLVVSECLGISSQMEELLMPITVFPNPNNGQFTILTDLKINLTLLNELGQVVRTISFSEEDKSHFVGDLPNGIYFILGQKDSQNVRLKIIVAR